MEKEDVNYRKLMDYSLRILTRRAYTIYELSQKLRAREQHSTENEQRVIERLTELGLLNDRDYIERSFDQALRLKQNGPTKVIQKLRVRGIPMDQAKQVWSETGDKALERDAAKKALEKALKRYASLERKQALLKASRNLMGKGFSPDLIFELVGEEKSKYNDYSQDQIE